jgi:hypothetical protein
LKKVGRGRSHELFSNWCFRNLHALGYPKIVTICWFIGFGLNTPSAWCQYYIVYILFCDHECQNWPKLVKIDRFSNLFGLFSRFSGSGTHPRRSYNEYIVKNETFSKKSKKLIFDNFMLILATFYEVKITFWKKYPKNVTICWFIGFGLNTPSAWCE